MATVAGPRDAMPEPSMQSSVGEGGLTSQMAVCRPVVKTIAFGRFRAGAIA